jgi:AbrB family looped-hinge helix DNA binding protein
MEERIRVILRSQNRIQIPKQICEALGLKPGAVLELRLDGDRIIVEVIAK